MREGIDEVILLGPALVADNIGIFKHSWARLLRSEGAAYSLDLV